MSQHNKKSQKTRARHAQRQKSSFFADLGRKTVTTDWSTSSGKLAHMNDPRMDNKVYRFVETLTAESFFSSSATIPTASATTFNLASSPNAGAYEALFDQYRIVQVELWVIPTGATVATEESALIKTVVDYDNATSTATLAYFDAYSNVHTTTAQNGHYRRFTPHIALAAFASAFTSYANQSMQWIDTAYPGVQHYGFKMFCDQTSAVIPFDLVVRLYLEFRNKI